MTKEEEEEALLHAGEETMLDTEISSTFFEGKIFAPGNIFE